MTDHAAVCSICRNVQTGDLIELDLLMGDPMKWPSSVWGVFGPGKGRMTPARRRYGAVEMGRNWLVTHGYEFSDKVIRNHYRYDVVVIATSVEDLLARGLIEADPRRDRALMTDLDAIDPKAFLTYFDRGIKLGNRALELMEKKVEAEVTAGNPISFAILKDIANLAAKLATTQASIKARGLRLEDDEEGEEGFRAGSMPEPSQRVMHHRIRVIDGSARPVHDEGPADRERYSRRAAEEGGDGLPH
jgi:hypothetical protein